MEREEQMAWEENMDWRKEFRIESDIRPIILPDTGYPAK